MGYLRAESDWAHGPCCCSMFLYGEDGEGENKGKHKGNDRIIGQHTGEQKIYQISAEPMRLHDVEIYTEYV